jgi:hypothetical protein
MTLLRTLVALCLLSHTQIGMPPPSQRPGAGLLVGQVVDSETGRPVPGAIVALTGVGERQSVAQLPRVITGGDGRFVFRDVGRGNYAITAAKGGYAEAAYGRTRAGGASSSLTVGDGERIGDLVLRIFKHAAISGAVTDESGERQVGVEVRAYRRSVVAGRRRFVPVGVGRTDDRGVYRVGTLVPGDYIVGTVARHIALPLSTVENPAPGSVDRSIVVEAGLATPDDRRTAVMQLGDAGFVFGRGGAIPPPPANGRLATYRPTFHPTASSGEAAAVITLRPGEEYGTADLQIMPVPSVRVSGTVLGPEGPLARSLLRLQSANTLEVFGDGDVPSTITDGAGNFTFLSVPSGDYTVKLSRGGGPPGQPGLVWLLAPLTVANEDISSLALVASPGVHVSGRVEFEGDPAKARTAAAGITITVESAEAPAAVAGQTFFTRTSATGDFMSQPLSGGRYYIRVPNSPAGWMFKGATVEGRDVSDTPVALTANLPNVVVTFTDKWSGLRGHVQGVNAIDAPPLVIVYPTDREMWGSSGLNPRRVRSAKPSANGEYSITVPPGDYYVAAVAEEFSADWQDPDFLDRATRIAARVTIAEGERKVQDLRPRDVR